MLLIGVTGGMGMGKSTVAEYLRRRGERVADTDELARRLVEPGQPALEEIVRDFGRSVLTPEGQLDRAALARVIFAGERQRERLESILHPRIRAEWLATAAAWGRDGAARGFVIIPLLFETGAEKELGLTLCVACSPKAQLERLRPRGWSEAEITQRLAAQWPAARKMDQSDRVIWNDSSLEICALQVERVLEPLPGARS